MGGAVSVSNPPVTPVSGIKIKNVILKKLPEAIEESIFVEERFPLLIDPTEQGGRFLKYQMGSFILFDDPTQLNKDYLNRALVGAMRYGRTLTIKFATMEGVTKDKLFTPGFFPVEVLTRQKFFTDEVWQSVLKPELGDPEPGEMTISQEFVLVLITVTEYVPPSLAEVMFVMRVEDKAAPSSSSGVGGVGGGEGGEGGEGDIMEAVAALYGAGEIKRNSLQLVEAAFDGDLDGIKDWIDKGFHIESCDGRKHTALSECACQGHLHVVSYLIQAGADPNALSDTGRSPLWRASFGGHLATVQALLEAGSNPEYRDRVSIESAFDVGRTDEVRECLSAWPLARTALLMDLRKRAILQKIEERIKTGAEREAFARAKIRGELVMKAEAGDTDGVREVLLMVAAEAEQTGCRPRATAEVRSETGQSLLSLAAQHDHEDLARMLLTHYLKCDESRWDLAEGELSVEAKVFKANVNSRDLKGWNCCCIAVFHTSLKVLRVLLEHGGDTSMRSSYNKHAHDLAKDELDAAGNVVKSKLEIREVLLEHDRSRDSSLFGGGKVVAVRGEADLYQDLHEDGSPVVMNIEFNNEQARGAENGGKAGKGGKGGAAKAGAVGGKKEKGGAEKNASNVSSKKAVVKK